MCTSMVLIQLHSCLYRCTYLFRMNTASRQELVLSRGAHVVSFLSFVLDALLLNPGDDSLSYFARPATWPELESLVATFTVTSMASPGSRTTTTPFSNSLTMAPTLSRYAT